jgi:hypothetical protein
MLRLVIVPSFDSAYAKNKIKIKFVHWCRATKENITERGIL